MKTACLIVAAGTLAVAGAAGAAEIEIEDAVARVIVIPEERADIGLEISQGSSGLPALEVRRRGDNVEIRGGLRRRIGSCGAQAEGATQPGEGARVRVRGYGDIDVSQAPLIVVRTPRDVDLDAGGAVFGAVGPGTASVDLSNAGCGEWTVGNTGGRLNLSVAGSGDIRAGTSRTLEVAVAGSGDISAGATGALDASIAGSGNVNVARVDGDIEAAIAGSGDVRVRDGRASRLEVSIAGSGDVRFDGIAGDVDASLIGSGDVRVAQVTGAMNRSVIGSGDIIVGR